MKKLRVWLASLLTTLVCISFGCGDKTTSQSGADSSEVAPQTPPSPSTQKATHAINLDESGRALRGFDPVEYLISGKAVEGKTEYTHEWAGAKWVFSNEQNQKSFIENPEKYIPANGGFCTFGVVLGKKFDGDPSVWSVQKDKLYVFLNEEVKETFFQDLDSNLAKVDDNWVLIKDKSPKELE